MCVCLMCVNMVYVCDMRGGVCVLCVFVCSCVVCIFVVWFVWCVCDVFDVCSIWRGGVCDVCV